MKDKAHLIGIYLLSLISVFLPWFTYNASVMGYCWGFYFLKWLALPLGMIALYLFAPKSNKAFLFLAEAGSIANLVILVIAFGKWQEVCNINSGFHWKDGLHTALPTYWISAALFLIFFAVFQADLLARWFRDMAGRRRRNGQNCG